MRRIGITTTIPSEIIYAAGAVPVDLNNVFITHKDRLKFIRDAEIDGMPRNFCAWVKGIYSAAKIANVAEVVIATQGDCSSTIILVEWLRLLGIDTITFSYPYNRDKILLKDSMERLAGYLGATMDAIRTVKKDLDRIRKKVHHIDLLTWDSCVVSGFHNHYFCVNTSDMQGDPVKFEKEIDLFLAEKNVEKKNQKDKIRLGYIGVPPIINGLYEFIEEKGGAVLFNEIQRQFSMPACTDDITEQYYLYTYPYSLLNRTEDINRETATRRLEGLIHYTQNFCHHQAEDALFRKYLNIPILSLEGDTPSEVDTRTKIRIEGFLNMLLDKKKDRL